MGLFLTIAWILLIIFIILEVYGYKKDKQTKRRLRSFQLLLIILMAIYSIIGIATKDPLSEIICDYSSLCIPVAVEWVVYVAVLGFLIWKFILVDMKRDIFILKREGRNIDHRLSKVEGTLDVVKSNTDKLLEATIKKRR